MADGYGFGAEGDWKTAALVRAMKVMARVSRAAPRSWKTTPITCDPGDEGARRPHAGSLPLDGRRKPRCEIHPLGIGGKSDPARLVFTAPAGPAVNAALLDMGDRFRLLSTR